MNELIVSQALWSEDSEALVKLRTEVFVDEQQLPSEIEVDGKMVSWLIQMNSWKPESGIEE
jgi:predicted GNAT family N-acyltransferase